MFKIDKLIIKEHKALFENFSYITLLQVFSLLAPFITFPYLVRVLGKDLYAFVLTAQVLASYASLIIDFGSNSVCAKHISLNREDESKISEIVSSVYCLRFLLFVACFFIYLSVVLIIPAYREHLLLFIFTYGLTINDLLFPQFFFQGMEKMKFIAIINIVMKSIFIGLVFLVVKVPSDYIFVPLLNSIGYTIGGAIALYIVFIKFKIKFHVPKMSVIMFYLRDSSAIFATSLICTIKDKLNYFFVGSFSGMANVIVYDLGLKFNSLITVPLSIINTVLFPKFAKNRDVAKLKKVMFISLLIAIVMVIGINILLPFIVHLFTGDGNIELMPLRLFLLAPIMLSVSSVISSNLFVAFGYNKYVFYSIVVTTIAYIISLLIAFLTNQLNGVYSFIIIALVSYLTELVYRLITAKKVINTEHNRIIKSI